MQLWQYGRCSKQVTCNNTAVAQVSAHQGQQLLMYKHTCQFAFLAIVVTAVFAISACGGGERMQQAYLNSNREKVDRPASVDSRPVRFVVEPGTPARVIGGNLRKVGLISDDLLFEAYVRVNGLAARLEAGTFVLAPSMTMAEIVDALQHAEAASVAITIPEGWRLEQSGDYLEAAGVFVEHSEEGDAYRDFTAGSDLAGLDPSRYPFLQDRPAGASLEGYLFPDTYEIPAEGATAADIVGRQLDGFAERVVPAYEAAVEEGKTDMDLFSVLTLASIVEREAVVAEERPAIAGVYLNRLSGGMRLEADPTVQYAMGYQPESDQWWKTPVYLEEYSSVDSPYNTYLYAGIPPGPIASPGLSSIQAVLEPEEHDYLYFVALADDSGAHVFAQTFEEHAQNVRQYQAGQ